MYSLPQTPEAQMQNSPHFWNPYPQRLSCTLEQITCTLHNWPSLISGSVFKQPFLWARLARRLQVEYKKKETYWGVRKALHIYYWSMPNLGLNHSHWKARQNGLSCDSFTACDHIRPP
eukprot:m.103786 g.103786  ORF g.103786 m.103786 type:complete len:118 (-) comp15055_c2_seq4:1760-2113(-)